MRPFLSPTQRVSASSVIRDRWFRLAVGLALATTVAGAMPVLPETARRFLALHAAPIPLAALGAVACLLTRREAPGDERAFWSYLSVSQVLACLAAVFDCVLSDFGVTGLPRLLVQASMAGAYVATIAGLASRPEDRAATASARSAAIAVFLGAFAYLNVVPALTEAGAYRSRMPSYTFYLLTDSFLALGFLRQAQGSGRTGLRRSGTYLATAFAGWAMTDLVNIAAAGGLFRVPAATWTDAAYLLPQIAFMAAARSGIPAIGDREASSPRWPALSPGWPPVLVMLIALPAGHLILSTAGILGHESHRGRELVVLLWIPVLLALAVKERAALEAARRRAQEQVRHLNDHLERRVEERTIELASALAEWRAIIDAIPSIVCVFDDRLLVRRLNQAAAELLRREPPACTGVSIDDLGDSEPWVSVRTILRGSKAPTAVTRGEGRAWSIETYNLTDGGGRGWLVRVDEISEELRAEEEEGKAREAAILGRMIAGVSHEVRNPLFALRALVDAWEAEGSEEAGLFGPRFRSQIDRLSHLTNQILEYSRPASMRFRTLKIETAVQAAASDVQALAHRAGVVIELQGLPALPLVRADEGHLEQVFVNLLDNAVRHSPPESRVTVLGSVRNGAIEIQIDDSGPGFKGDELERAFEPFFTRRRGGTGLGLAIVGTVLRAHGGTITASNRPGGGARMVVTIPSAAGEEASALSSEFRRLQAPNPPVRTLE
jgi:signal transduction histidine kinase